MAHHHQRQDSRGFSLIEVLLSVSIIGIITGISIPVYNSFTTRNDLELNAQQIADTLRRAQTYARGMEGNSAWSVEIQTAAVTLFKGTNFGGRDTSFDEVVSLPGSITVTSGTGEVQFAKLTATPNTTANFTLTSNNNDTRTVTVNGRGMVTY